MEHMDRLDPERRKDASLVQRGILLPRGEMVRLGFLWLLLARLGTHYCYGLEVTSLPHPTPSLSAAEHCADSQSSLRKMHATAEAAAAEGLQNM